MRQWMRAMFVLALLLYLVLPVYAVNININPQAPPGLGKAIETILGWAAWVGIAICALIAIGGAVLIYKGDEVGKRYLIGGLLGAVVIASLGQILGAL